MQCSLGTMPPDILSGNAHSTNYATANPDSAGNPPQNPALTPVSGSIGTSLLCKCTVWSTLFKDFNK